MTVTGELTDIRSVYGVDGPFATIYLDGTRATDSGGREVELRWRAARDSLANQGMDDGSLDALADVIDGDRSPGRHGLVAVAAQGEVHFLGTTDSPPARDSATVDALPHLFGWLAAQTTHPVFALVAVDRTGGDITIRSPFGVAAQDTVDGPQQYPLHKVGQDEWSELHFQHRVENAWEANAREVADAVQAHAARFRPELIIVAGEDRARGLLVDQLSGAVSGAPVVGIAMAARADGSSTDALDLAVRDEILRHVWRQRREVLERLQQDVGRGQYAATGVRGVVDALTRAQVDTLVVSDDPSSTLRAWIGPAPTEIALSEDDLRGMGVHEPKQARFDAALVRAAVCTGARLLITPDAHQYVPQGIAAILRY